MRPPIVMTSWILWGALLLLVGVYAGLMTILKPDGAGQPTGVLVSILLGAAGFNALAVFIARFFLRRHIHKENRKEKPNWAPLYLPLAILIWALSEAISIYGLVLFLIGTPPMTCLLFLGTSVALLVFNMPALLIPKIEVTTTGPLDSR